MLKKLIFIIIGVFLIAVVVSLGIKAAQNSSYVTWFGIASAVLAPSAFAIIGYGFKIDERHLFQQLSRIPEIDKLIREASTQEEKIALLEQERARLNEIIQVEARRQTLVASRESLEQDMTRILKDYNAIIEELALINIRIEESPVLQEMKRIQERIKARREGRVIVLRFGKREFFVPESKFSDSGIDILALLVLRLIERLQHGTAKKVRQQES